MCHSSKCCSEELNSPPLMNSLISLFIPDKQLSPLTEWGSGGKVESSRILLSRKLGGSWPLPSHLRPVYFVCLILRSSLIHQTGFNHPRIDLLQMVLISFRLLLLLNVLYECESGLITENIPSSCSPRTLVCFSLQTLNLKTKLQPNRTSLFRLR